MSHDTYKIVNAMSTIHKMDREQLVATMEKLLKSAPTAVLRSLGVKVPVQTRRHNDPHEKVADEIPLRRGLVFKVVTRDLVENNKILFIKTFREETGAGLSEAKNWCEGQTYSGGAYVTNPLKPGEWRNNFTDWNEAQAYAVALQRRVHPFFRAEVLAVEEPYTFRAPWIRVEEPKTGLAAALAR